MVCSFYQVASFILLTPIVLSKSVYYSSERNTKTMELASDGHKRWSMMESMSKNPDCWTKAYASIQSNCIDMSGDEKLTFSWNVLVCYFEDTGRRIPQCAYSTIRECTSHLSSFDFDVFTQMYNHGDSFCFYRESKEWQRKTDQSINHLEDVTDETINRLDASLEKEETLLTLQSQNLELHSTSLSQSAQVLERISQAEEQLNRFHNDLHSSFVLMKNETETFYDSIRSISNWTNTKLESLSSLNHLIHDSLSTSQSLINFALKIGIVFFITSLPGLTLLRPYCYIYIVICTLLERLFLFRPFCNFPESVLHCVLFCVRVGVIVISSYHFVYSILSRRNWDKENNQLLISLQKQMVDYQQQLQSQFDSNDIVFSDDEDYDFQRVLFPLE